MVWGGRTGQGPSPGQQAHTSWDTCQALTAPVAAILYNKKYSCLHAF